MAKTKILKAKTIRGIRKMIAAVLAEPTELDQDQYPYRDMPACDTPFCAAGHIIRAMAPKKFKELLARGRTDNVDWAIEAARIMELPSPLGRYSLWKPSLFGTVASWPKKYALAYYRADTRKTEKARAKGRARAFAARWENLIETGGKELEWA